MEHPWPFHFLVTLTHPIWEAAGDARSYRRRIAGAAADLFAEYDAAQLVRDLGGWCLVSRRRASSTGALQVMKNHGWRGHKHEVGLFGLI